DHEPDAEIVGRPGIDARRHEGRFARQRKSHAFQHDDGRDGDVAVAGEKIGKLVGNKTHRHSGVRGKRAFGNRRRSRTASYRRFPTGMTNPPMGYSRAGARSENKSAIMAEDNISIGKWSPRKMRAQATRTPARMTRMPKRRAAPVMTRLRPAVNMKVAWSLGKEFSTALPQRCDRGRS